MNLAKANTSRPALLRPTEAAERVGCSKRHLYRLAARGELPPAQRLSHKRSAWSITQIEDLMARRKCRQ